MFNNLIRIKAGKSLTHSSCHWEEWFLQKLMSLCGNFVSPTQFPLWDTSYKTFHIWYYFLIGKSRWLILLTSIFISLISPHLISLFSKMYSRNFDSPNYIEFSKNQKKVVRFVWYRRSYKRKKYFEPCFQLLKLNDLGQFESLNKFIFVKKKEKQYRQSGILLFTMLKTLDSYLYMKLNLVKNQLWIRS